MNDINDLVFVVCLSRSKADRTMEPTDYSPIAAFLSPVDAGRWLDDNYTRDRVANGRTRRLGPNAYGLEWSDGAVETYRIFTRQPDGRLTAYRPQD